ncbi:MULTISPECIES: helix-turn-helix transcriptional regulator [unclassified Sutcliffiella]|uniref:helix-turn-helix transcriptional regulator n=1 Tax=unclassified Sutcliffiella TaxID=2837532 RepID=UPI0030CFA0A7
MFGLGKDRTKFGKWLDRQEDITQSDIAKAARVSNETVSKLCRDKEYVPKFETVMKIKKGLMKLDKEVPDRYFDM